MLKNVKFTKKPMQTWKYCTDKHLNKFILTLIISKLLIYYFHKRLKIFLNKIYLLGLKPNQTSRSQSGLNQYELPPVWFKNVTDWENLTHHS